MDPRLSHALVAILAILGTVTVYELGGSGRAEVEAASSADAKRSGARDRDARLSKEEYRRKAAGDVESSRDELRRVRERTAELPPDERRRALLRYARERRGQQADAEVRQVDADPDERARLKEAYRQRALGEVADDGR